MSRRFLLAVSQQNFFSKKNSQRCNKTLSLRHKTIFAHFNLTLGQTTRLIFFLVDDIPIQKVKLYVAILEPTICEFAELYRHIIYNYMMLNSTTVGGFGKFVEIDEIKIEKRKYNKVYHSVEGQWVFGDSEAGSGNCFLEAFSDRIEKTLLSMIKN